MKKILSENETTEKPYAEPSADSNGKIQTPILNH